MILSAFLSAFFAASAPQDTLPVAQAMVSEPVVAMPVYQTDTADLGGKSLADNHFFDENAVASFIKRAGDRLVLCGDVLPQAKTSGALYVVKFQVATQRYVKATILYNKPLKNSQLFFDGKKNTGSLVFKPGVTEVALLCQTDTARTDTFDISLIGEHAAELCILDEGDKKPMNLNVMREGGFYSDLRLSPTGKYLITLYHEASSEGDVEYWTTLTETETGRVLARETGKKDWQWLENRDEIYYSRPWNKRTQLVFRQPNGTERVLADDLPVNHFTLSPTEDYIIYSKHDENREKSGVLRRLEQPDDRMPDWGKRGTLYRYDLRTGVSQRLTFGRESVSLYDISPDGKRLLLGYRRFQPARKPFQRVTLLEMDAQTGHIDTLLLDTTFISSAQYSADATSLLIKGSPDAFDGIGRELPAGRYGNAFDYRLYRYDIVSHQTMPLLPNFNASVEQVFVPQRGDMIYVTATESYGRSLWRVDTKTKQRVRYELPLSYLQRVSIATASAAKPACVFYGFSGERARDCYLTELGAKSAVRCENIGEVRFDSIYKNVAVGTCRDWNFLSSNGDSIAGFYFLPADFDPNKTYPLIVYYYGGCTPTPKTFEFLYPHTVLAAQGYVVYVVEPSGAIGFSQEFASRHVGTWGRGSAEEIIEGTRAFCDAHPFVNKERIGCIGASYGGFMTEYLQTQTDLFRTAISHAGISNIASYWGGGYWGYTYGQVAQYGDYPWNNPELYTRQSPLFSADKIHTPLLLLHGTEDTNVPTTESQQLFTALRILGRPVSFVQVNGENHVVVDATKRARWQEAIFAWFAYWLKDQHEWWRDLFPGDDFGVGIKD